MTTTTENESPENRVLVFMPTGRDALLVCQMLEKSSISALPCAGVKDLEEKFESGAGAVLLAEEALQNGTLELFIELIDRHLYSYCIFDLVLRLRLFFLCYITA